MKLKLLLLFTLVSISLQLVMSQTNISEGNVSGVWTKSKSPYLINGNIKIPNGEKLEIQPGVQVVFTGEYELDIKGQLLAEGSLSDSIIFTSSPSVKWKSIIIQDFFGTPDDVESRLSFCRIENASNYNGAALMIFKHSRILIEHNTFQNNAATFGGSIYIREASPLIQFNTIINNSASGSGGALYVYKSGAKIYANIISNNKSSYEGAVHITETDSAQVHSNVICNNLASQKGAGIFVNRCSPVLNNNTIAYNHSKGHAGGIYGKEAKPVFNNTIIFANSTGFETWDYKLSQVGVSDDFMPDFHYCAIQNGVSDFSDTYSGNSDNISTNDPKFIQASDTSGIEGKGYLSNWGLKDDSPYLNAGKPDLSNLVIPEFDYQQKIRIKETIELGAWEKSNGQPQIGMMSDLSLKDTYTYSLPVYFTDPNPDDKHSISVYSDKAEVSIVSVNGNTSGSLVTLNIAQNWAGTAKITITVSDNSSESNNTDIKTFNLTISINNPPVIEAINDLTVDEDTPLSFKVYFTDADKDDAHTINLIENELFKSTLVKGDTSGSEIVINFQNNWNGSTKVGIIVNDGWTGDTLWVNVNVVPVNDAPILGKLENIRMRNDIPYSFALSYEDYDKNDLISIQAYSSNDTLKVESMMWGKEIKITLSCNDDWEGKATLTVKISDGQETVDATCNVEVIGSTKINAGAVYGIWKKSLSPYFILGNIEIPDDSSLVIEPGVKVFFNKFVSINVKGSIVAKGTILDSIIFTSENNRWYGIKIGDRWENNNYLADNDSSIFEFCHFSNSTNSTISVADFNKTHFKHCSFINNQSHLGGAIQMNNSFAFIENCLFQNNLAYSSGGAIDLYGDSGTKAWIVNNKFINNSAEYGGAIYSYGTNMYLVNNILAENSAIKEGGAIQSILDKAVYINNTICNNSSENLGGGIFSYSYINNKNCIYWGNRAKTGTQFYDDWGGGISFSNSIIENGAVNKIGNNCIYSNPLLDSLYRPQSYSRAVNAGTINVDTLLTKDIHGQIRIYEDSIDIGAYELQVSVQNRGPRLVIPQKVTLMFNSSLNIDFSIDDPDKNNFSLVAINTNENISASVLFKDETNGTILINAKKYYIGVDTITLLVNDSTNCFNSTDTAHLIVMVTDQSYFIAPDTIWENTKWDYDLVEVNNDIVVKEGATLDILAGTTLRFSGEHRIIVYGNLNTLGKENLPVLFTIKDTSGYSSRQFNGWSGISLFNLNNLDTSVFNWTIFEYSNTIYTDNDSKSALLINNNNSIKIDHCIFRNNASDFVGCLFLQKGKEISITNTLFEKNYGGSSSVVASLIKSYWSNCQFLDNYSEDDGTVQFYNESVRILNCLFDANSVKKGNEFAGLLKFSSDTCLVSNCVISNNSADLGILDFRKSRNVTIENSSLINNQGTPYTVCIYTRNVEIALKNTIFFNKELSFANGGSNNDNSHYTFINCLLSPNEKIKGLADSSNLIRGNPMLDSFSNSISLLKGSPCIDAGTLDSILQTDYDYFGNKRVVNNKIDIGAAEYHENSPIQAIKLTDTIVCEKFSAPFFITTIKCVDTDLNDNFSYKLKEIPGVSLNNQLFKISGDSLWATKPVSYAEYKELFLGIMAKSSGGDSLTTKIKLLVNDKPSDLKLSKSELYENNKANSIIGELVILDKDSVIFEIADYRMRDTFEIQGRKLMIKKVLNYETNPGKYDIQIRATDALGASLMNFVTVELKDTNEVPVLKYETFIAQENKANQLICTFLISDEEQKQVTPTITVVDNVVNISHDNNSVWLADKVDYEKISSFKLNIKYDDQFYFKDSTFTIYIKDINEAPTSLSFSKLEISENNLINDTIAVIAVEDQDKDDKHTFEISDIENFRVVNNVILANKVFDFETKYRYNVSITAHDSGKLSYSLDTVITIIDQLGDWVPTINSETFKVYPNPANNFIYVSGNTGIQYLKLFDAQGKLVLNQKATSSQSKIDLSSLEEGSYYLRVYSFNQEYEQKIIIQRK